MFILLHEAARNRNACHSRAKCVSLRPTFSDTHECIVPVIINFKVPLSPSESSVFSSSRNFLTTSGIGSGDTFLSHDEEELKNEFTMNFVNTIAMNFITSVQRKGHNRHMVVL